MELGYTERMLEGSVRPRVWWCPTGILSILPIHAAGYHKPSDETFRTVLDRVVSSYTSTIKALKYSRDRPTSSIGSSALVAAMPTTPQHAALPMAEDEAF